MPNKIRQTGRPGSGLPPLRNHDNHPEAQGRKDGWVISGLKKLVPAVMRGKKRGSKKAVDSRLPERGVEAHTPRKNLRQHQGGEATEPAVTEDSLPDQPKHLSEPVSSAPGRSSPQASEPKSDLSVDSSDNADVSSDAQVEGKTHSDRRTIPEKLLAKVAEKLSPSKPPVDPGDAAGLKRCQEHITALTKQQKTLQAKQEQWDKKLKQSQARMERVDEQRRDCVRDLAKYARNVDQTKRKKKGRYKGSKKQAEQEKHRQELEDKKTRIKQQRDKLVAEYGEQKAAHQQAQQELKETLESITRELTAKQAEYQQLKNKIEQSQSQQKTVVPEPVSPEQNPQLQPSPAPWHPLLPQDSDSESVTSEVPSEALSELESEFSVDSSDDVDELLETLAERKTRSARRTIPEKLLAKVAEKFYSSKLPVDPRDAARLELCQEHITALTKQQKTLQVELDKYDRELKPYLARVTEVHQQNRNCSRDLAEHAKTVTLTKNKQGEKYEGSRKQVAQEKRQKTLEQRQASIKQQLQERLDEYNQQKALQGQARQELQSVFDGVTSELAANRAEYKQLNDKIEQTKTHQKVVVQQLISLALNLRRIHKGKAAVGDVNLPELTVPVKDSFASIKNVRLTPSAIRTRTDDQGRPVVDVVLKDVHGQLDIPVEGGARADMEADVSDVTLTMGGDVADAFKRYLNCKGNIASVAHMLSGLTRVVTGVAQGEIDGEAINLQVQAGDIQVKTQDTSANLLVRGIASARREPVSGLNTMLSLVPVPINVDIDSLAVDTDGEVRTLTSARGVHMQIVPDITGNNSADQRTGAVRVQTDRASVDAEGPVGLLTNVVGQLQPDEPLAQLPGELGNIVSSSLLDKLPANACRRIHMELEGVDVALEREMNHRTTKASPSKEVWCAEGAERNQVQVKNIKLSAQGDLGIDAQARNLSVDIHKSDQGQTVKLSVAPDDDTPQAESARLKLTCEPGLISALTGDADNETLRKLLVDGKGSASLSGRAALELDPATGAISSSVEQINLGTDKSVLVSTPDIAIRLPATVQGQANKLSVNSTPGRWRQYSESRTDIALNRLELSGQGELGIELGTPGQPGERHIKLPLNGQGSVSGFEISALRRSPADQRRSRQQLLLSVPPEGARLAIDNIEAGTVKVGKVEVSLDDELNGRVNLNKVRVGFNDLVNPKARFKAGDDGGSVELTDPVPMPGFIGRLLRNKTLELDGALPVRNGSFKLQELATTRIRVVPQRRVGKKQAALADRLLAGIANVGFSLGLKFIGSKLLRIGDRDGRPVVESSLLPNVKIPVPEQLNEAVTFNRDGSVNVPATQALASGVYCFPASQRARLDQQLASLREEPVSDTLLSALLDDIEQAEQTPETLAQALYLLQSLPVEAIAADAADNATLRAALERAAGIASHHRQTAELALAIYNDLHGQGVRPSAPVLERLTSAVDNGARGEAELAELLFRESQLSKALPRLLAVVQNDRKDFRSQRLLARILLETRSYDKAFEVLRDAGMAGDPAVITTLKAMVDQPKHQGSAARAKLLLAALLLHREQNSHSAEAFLEGVEQLEQLASDAELGESARNLLLNRCQNSFRIVQDFPVEDWELWSRQVAATVERLEQNKSLKLSDEQRYRTAMALLYGYGGVARKLAMARSLLQTFSPRPDNIQTHLDVLGQVEKVEQEQQAAEQQNSNVA